MATIDKIKSGSTTYNIMTKGTTCTVGTTWSGTAPNLYQNVTVSGITADLHPILSLKLAYNATQAVMDAANENWAKIYAAETYDGGITFWAKEATTGSSITVQINEI